MAIAVAAFMLMAAVDSASVASAKDTSPPVDTSITKASDTLTLAKTADSSAGAPAADTAGAAPAADTSASSDSDTPESELAPYGDSAQDLDPFSLFQEDEKTAPKESRLLNFVFVNAPYILFLGLSLAVILATLFYYLRKQDTRRFLTTTRLSVLDKMVQKGCRYIESNYMNPDLSVSAVCRELVTGEAYLDTLFVKEIGIDVHDFIAQVRVNRIKNRLREDPTIDPEYIYKQYGFTDRASADRSFAKLCGGVGMDVYAKSLMSAGKTPEA